MMNNDSANTTGRKEKSPAGKTITPELVQQVADRVYAMLLSELKLENERSRVKGPSPRGR